MTANTDALKAIVARLAPHFKAHGFRKKGNQFTRPVADGYTWVVDFALGRAHHAGEGQFYCVPYVHMPELYSRNWGERIPSPTTGALGAFPEPFGHDRWFDLDPESGDRAIAEIEAKVPACFEGLDSRDHVLDSWLSAPTGFEISGRGLPRAWVRLLTAADRMDEIETFWRAATTLHAAWMSWRQQQSQPGDYDLKNAVARDYTVLLEPDEHPWAWPIYRERIRVVLDELRDDEAFWMQARQEWPQWVRPEVQAAVDELFFPAGAPALKRRLFGRRRPRS